MFASTSSEWGLGRQAQAASLVLRVRTGPEFPEGNLMELMWDSNPNRGIAKETKKQKQKPFPTRGSNSIRWPLACSQNKGLSNYQRRASCLRTGPSPCWRLRGRQGTARARSKGNLGPRDGILHQTVSRHLVANQLFLGSWTTNIFQESCSLRSAPQRRHTAHLRWHFHDTPGKPNNWDQGGD